MLLYLARATQVIDSEVRDPRSYLDNVGTLQASIDEAKRALGIALMRKARSMNSGTKEFDIHWDKPLKAEADEMEILVTLIEAYEHKHYPIGPADPVEAIKFKMDQAGLTPKDLELYIGSSGRVSEVLNRKRGLSLQMVKRLHLVQFRRHIQNVAQPLPAALKQLHRIRGFQPHVGPQQQFIGAVSLVEIPLNFQAF